jgi:hypothetical protein
MRWTRKAAEQGDGDAQSLLKRTIRDGLGVGIAPEEEARSEVNSTHQCAFCGVGSTTNGPQLKPCSRCKKLVLLRSGVPSCALERRAQSKLHPQEVEKQFRTSSSAISEFSDATEELRHSYGNKSRRPAIGYWGLETKAGMERRHVANKARAMQVLPGHARIPDQDILLFPFTPLSSSLPLTHAAIAPLPSVSVAWGVVRRRVSLGFG